MSIYQPTVPKPLTMKVYQWADRNVIIDCTWAHRRPIIGSKGMPWAYRNSIIDRLWADRKPIIDHLCIRMGPS